MNKEDFFYITFIFFFFFLNFKRKINLKEKIKAIKKKLNFLI
jgi:hypothetical protein